jgi:hypothetical protein
VTRKATVRLTVYAILAAVALTASAARSQPVELIPAPENWVSFSADVRIYQRGSETPTTVGRFFQGADGSDRMETGPVEDPTRVISIKNIARVTSYMKTSAGRWSAAPMEISPERGWRPPKWRLGTPALTPHPYRLAIRAGENGDLQAADGFEAFVHVDQYGNVDYMVPTLNFFRAVRESPSMGYKALYFNIRLEPQPAALFEPPPGVAVEKLDKPRGITIRKRPSGGRGKTP